MIAVLIDAVLLLVLLKLINDGDRDFVTALVVAVVVSVGAPILVFAMLFTNGDPTAIGDTEIVIAVTAAMALLAGIALLVLGVDPKKSLLTAALYSTIHFGVAFGLDMLPAA